METVEGVLPESDVLLDVDQPRSLLTHTVQRVEKQLRQEVVVKLARKREGRKGRGGGKGQRREGRGGKGEKPYVHTFRKIARMY